MKAKPYNLSDGDIAWVESTIAAMLKFGYDPDKVVMVGDAPGDCDAAEKNGVPVLFETAL